MKTISIITAFVAIFAFAAHASAKTTISSTVANSMGMKKIVRIYDDIKTVYLTDAQGRVTSKITLKANGSGWTPVSAYSVGYGEEKNTLTFAEWNKSKNAFTANPEQQSYDAKEFPVLINIPKN